MSSMLQRSPSRPSPESFTPPYGIGSMRQVGMSLTITPPTSSSSCARSVRSSDEVKSPHCRPKRRVVDLAQRGVEVVDREEVDHRRERLLAADPRPAIHVHQDGGWIRAAVRRPAGQGACPVGQRLLHPFVRARDRLVVDHRSEVGRRVERIPDLHAARVRSTKRRSNSS